MAAGDIAYDADPVRRAGNMFEIHGTIEVDSVNRTFAILDTTHYIVSATLVPVDAPGTISLGINLAADFSTAANGSLAVDADVASVTTCRFAIQYAP